MSATQPKPVCGFIGLGSQGAPLAQRMIDAGYRVLLWARRPATLDPFRGSPAVLAESAAELGARADYVALCVIDDAAVLEMCAALIPVMKRGSIIAVHSTTLPETCRALAREAASRGIDLIDAPVSGGAPGAKAGTMTVMVGGPVQILEAARPVFETFASLIVHLGDVGAGQLAKLINNSLMVANIALAHSAVTIGAEHGLDRQALGALLRASSGASFGLDVYVRQPDISAFSNLDALLEKVRLLGEVIGVENDAYQVLSHSVRSLKRTV